MKIKVHLNPSVSYRLKNGIYVFYYDFNYVFFSGKAARLIDQLLDLLTTGKCLESLPESFLDYLKSKNIIIEE